MTVAQPLSHNHLSTVKTETAIMMGIGIEIAIIIITIIVVVVAPRLSPIHPCPIPVTIPHPTTLPILLLIINTAVQTTNLATEETRRKPQKQTQIQPLICLVVSMRRVACFLSGILQWMNLRTWSKDLPRFCFSCGCCMIFTFTLFFDPCVCISWLPFPVPSLVTYS